MAKAIKNITVLGAGDMGHGIAEVALLAGFNVVLRDIKQEFVARGAQRIIDSLAVFVRKEKISAADRDAMVARMSTSIDLAESVANADLVIEAVPEILELKIQTFKDVDQHAPDHCILASNTSTMSISKMASSTRRPQKIAGLHYFNPAVLMATVEVIRTEYTSDETFNSLFEFCQQCGKSPVRVEKDVPGFIVNRVQSMAAILLDCWLDKGIDPETIDAVLRTQLGTPMGPCETIDYTGVDVNYHGFSYFAETLHSDHTPGTVLTRLFNEGKLGKKTGQGMFDWSHGRPTIDLTKTCDEVKADDLLLVNANEALQLIEQGVATAADIQNAIIGATGNPAGIFNQLKHFDQQAVVKRLNELAETYNKQVFRPCKTISTGDYREFDS